MIRSLSPISATLLAGALLVSACGPGGDGDRSVSPTIPTSGDTPSATMPTTAPVARTAPSFSVPIGSASFADLGPSETRPEPVSMTIDAIDVEAAIVAVGVEANDELEVPGATEVGWYEFGPRPGEPAGSAVLAAHVDYNGRPGVFFDLRSVQAGDRVQVDLDDGSTQGFEIVALEQYEKNELPVDRVFARSGEPILTLITCGGAFDESARSYQDNVVVFAIPA